MKAGTQPVMDMIIGGFLCLDRIFDLGIRTTNLSVLPDLKATAAILGVRCFTSTAIR